MFFACEAGIWRRLQENNGCKSLFNIDLHIFQKDCFYCEKRGYDLQ